MTSSMPRGFGICGHQNSYSSRVRCGNWAEDTIGLHLAKTKQATPLIGESESRSRYTDYRKKLNSEKDTEANKNTDSNMPKAVQELPRTLLLNHGEVDKFHSVRPEMYQSSYSLMFGREEKNGHLIPSGTLKKQMRYSRKNNAQQFCSVARKEQAAPFKPQAAAVTGKPDAERRGSSMSFSRSFLSAQKSAKMRGC